jgi:hypothetical protein
MQTNCTPSIALLPADVKMAVVNEPIWNISGKKVLSIEEINIGTIIIPAGIFFRNLIIIISTPL